jgi:hypothetical protein
VLRNVKNRTTRLILHVLIILSTNKSKNAVFWPTKHTLRIHFSVLKQVKRVFDTTLFNRMYVPYTGKVQPTRDHDGLDRECRKRLQFCSFFNFGCIWRSVVNGTHFRGKSVGSTTGTKDLTLKGFRFTDSSVRSESLYRLSYPSYIC